MKLCRGCQGEIFWVTMETSGKAMPLDPEHSDVGTVMVDDAGRGHTVRADAPTMPRYVPHWATCPTRAHFKKAKRA